MEIPTRHNKQRTADQLIADILAIDACGHGNLRLFASEAAVAIRLLKYRLATVELENRRLREEIDGACAPDMDAQAKMQCNNCGGQMFRSAVHSDATVCIDCGMKHIWEIVRARLEQLRPST